jgi:hypothetical protein
MLGLRVLCVNKEEFNYKSFDLGNINESLIYEVVLAPLITYDYFLYLLERLISRLFNLIFNGIFGYISVATC